MTRHLRFLGVALSAILCLSWFLGAVFVPGYAAELTIQGTLLASSETAPSATVANLAQTEKNDQSITETTVSSKTLKEQVEQAKENAATKAKGLLGQEAIAAVEETKNAIASIESGNIQEAIQALERATGKLDILLAREPELALIPVSSTVEIIDVAPSDEQMLKDYRNRVKSAINAGNLPEARELLNNLMSEVRTETLNLPLATYPDAMKEAARLLDGGNAEAAKDVLQVALSTLVVTEDAQSIPVINARTNLIGAAAVAELDKEDAIRLLEDARQELQLAQNLGYINGDREYSQLERDIQDIEKKIRSDSGTLEAFTKLQNKLSELIE